MIAKGSFVIDKKDVQPVEWQGGQMSHTRFYKTFTGDLTGTSIVEAIMIAAENDGASVYVGVERFECAVHGKTGTFLLTHGATHHAGGGVTDWKIVAGSGTGELQGITGTAEILPKHDFELTYQLP
ncbi:MAG: DUF3224 domain-containing protein [Vicinamibacterales bacterium]